MFGHNIITGRKFFREHSEAQAGKLLVTSVFRTVQGEGPFAGAPAVFVRLAMCNLACPFCDTYFDGGDWVTPAALYDAVAAEWGRASPPGLVVITGGEPALQSEALCGFMRECGARSRGRIHIQIESNGILPIESIVGWNRGTIVLSPKCVGQRGYPELPSASLKAADCLKFVLSGDPASSYHLVPEWAVSWRCRTGREVYVSPMAEYHRSPEQTRALYDARSTPDMAARTAAERVSFWESGLLDMEKCRRNYEYAAQYALEHDLRLTLQMHLFASMP